MVHVILDFNLNPSSVNVSGDLFMNYENVSERYVRVTSWRFGSVVEFFRPVGDRGRSDGGCERHVIPGALIVLSLPIFGILFIRWMFLRDSSRLSESGDP